MRDRIENSRTFLALSPLKQNIYKSRAKMQQVEHHYHLAKHLGMVEWIAAYQPEQYIKDVVEEFLSYSEKIVNNPASTIFVASASGKLTNDNSNK